MVFQVLEDSEKDCWREKTKYDIIVHAEMNALAFAKCSVEGCTLYTWPFQPCSRCAGFIIQAGIKRVVTLKNNDKRWEKNFKTARQLFDESGIILESING